MSKAKIVSALLAIAISVPLLAVSTTASAHYKRYHHGCSGYGYHGHYRCGYGLRNMALVYHVVRQLRADPATADQAICVTAVGHKVTLSGYTGTAMQKQTAINITRYSCGVSLVVDNLRVQP